MKVVVDEGVPRQLVRALRDLGIDASRFRPAWQGLYDQALLDVAEAAGFTILVTNDKNMAHQQNLAGRGIGVVALPLNRRAAIIRRVEDIADTLRHTGPGVHVLIRIDGHRTATRMLDGRPMILDLPKVRPFDP